MAKQAVKESAPKKADFTEESARAFLKGVKTQKGDVLYVCSDGNAFRKRDFETGNAWKNQNGLKMIKIVISLLLVAMLSFSADAQNVRWPFADATYTSLTDSDSVTLQISNTFTIVNADTGSIGQAITELNISSSSSLPTGSTLILFIQQGSTGRNITMGDEFDTVHAPNLTGVASDKDLLYLIWTGYEWVALTAAWQKILDAA